MTHLPAGLESAPPDLTRARELAARLPLDQVIGRLLCAVCLHRPIDDVAAMVARGQVGTVLPGRGDLRDPGSAAAHLRSFAAAAPAGLPLLYAADFEAGVASMVAQGATRLPAMLALAAISDPAERHAAASLHGRITARESLAIGVGLAFAPVADLADHPLNPIINTRGPGADPAIAGEIVARWIAAAREEGLAATAKHFPGHGPVAGDSHLATPVCSEGGDALIRTPLEPFRAAIGAGCEAMMVAHVHYPALQPQGERRRRLPASLSRAVVHDLLRRDLHFEGLIATDSLSMHAITSGMSLAEAAEEAIRAGNDLCLIEAEFEAVHDHLMRRVGEGALDEARLRESAGRVIALAGRAAVATSRARSARGSFGAFRTAHAEAALSIARRAATSLAAPDAPTSLRQIPERIVILANAPRSRREGAPILLAELIAPRAEVIELFDDAELSQLEQAERWAADAESDAAPPLLAIIVRRPIAYRQGGLRLSPRLRGLEHTATGNGCGVVFLGSVPPEEQWEVPANAPIIATWSSDSASAIAVAEVLLGGPRPVGRVPMPLD